MRGQAIAASGGPAPRPASCILVWVDGGPSHHETFDPKPDAPKEIRGDHEPVPTKIPGVFFAQHMKRLAAIGDKLGYSADDRILSPESFAATVYTQLGVNPDKIYYAPEGRPVHLVSDPTPIGELL